MYGFVLILKWFFFDASGRSFNKQEVLESAAYELFKARFNLYLAYGNYINAHLSDLKILRDMSLSLLPRFKMFDNTDTTNRSFVNPKVDKSLVAKILDIIHSTFTIDHSTVTFDQIRFPHFKLNIEAKKLCGQEVVFVFVALMRAVGADVSLACSFSVATNSIFWAEVFIDGEWTLIEPVSRAIGFTVIFSKQKNIQIHC